MALQGEAKKAYQRELMRKRRAIEVIAEIGEVRGVMREGKCALLECGKPFKTTLPLMRFCSREHQLERLRQLTTLGSGIGRDVEVPK